MKKTCVGRIGTWLAAGLAMGLLAGCGVGVTPEARVKRAEELLAQGDYGAAMLEIRNALQATPNNAAAELVLARASLLLNNTDAAGRTLDQALAHGADKGAVSRLRVQLLQQTGANAELLKQLDANSLTLGEPQRDLARAQALTGLRRCPEAIPVARPLLADAAVQVAARIVLAECYAQAGHPQLALELLQAAVKSEPKDPEAWLALGRFQQVSGKSSDAEASWRQATENAAGRLTALQLLSVYTAVSDQQLARGELDAASETHKRMVRIAPQGGLSMLLEARLKMARGTLEPAIADLQTLTNASKDFDGARSALASALLAAGKREQALAEVANLSHDRPQAVELRSGAELLRKSATTDDKKEEYWLASAGVQMLLGQPAMARLALQRAAEVAPQSTRPLTTRIQLELRIGNFAEALRLAQDFQSQHPDDPPALLLLAQVQRAKGAPADAAATLEKLQARQPTASTAVLLYSMQRELDPATASKTLQDWVDKHPDDHSMRAVLADGLMTDGKNAQAAAEYEKLLQISPKNVLVLNNLAWLYYLGKDPRAVPTARRAYEVAPKAVSIVDTYGWLLLESGANEEGLKVLSTLKDAGVLIDPDTRYHYAAALARTGQKDEAARQLALLLNEAPEFPARADAVALAANVK